MKSRGFGLPNMFAFLLIFIILLLTVSVIVHQLSLDSRNNYLLAPTHEKYKKSKGKNSSNNDIIEYDYSMVEKKLKNAAAQYQKDYYPGYDESDALFVTSKKLIALDYLPVLTDGQVSCKGYARITYDNVIQVEPFIKCGKYYKTKGYSSSLAD